MERADRAGRQPWHRLVFRPQYHARRRGRLLRRKGRARGRHRHCDDGVETSDELRRGQSRGGFDQSDRDCRAHGSMDTIRSSLDMSTSAAALGKIMAAKKSGRAIPLGWGADATGADTTDPNAVKFLLPMAGAKGSGLSLMIEVLASVLVGNPLISSALTGNAKGAFNGLAMALNIDAFGDRIGLPASDRRAERRDQSACPRLPASTKSCCRASAATVRRRSRVIWHRARSRAPLRRSRSSPTGLGVPVPRRIALNQHQWGDMT